MMKSQIRSFTDYLIPTDTIAVLLLHWNFILKYSLIGAFSTRFNDNSEVAYFLLSNPVECCCNFAVKVRRNDKLDESIKRNNVI